MYKKCCLISEIRKPAIAYITVITIIRNRAPTKSCGKNEKNKLNPENNHDQINGKIKAETNKKIETPKQ